MLIWVNEFGRSSKNFKEDDKTWKGNEDGKVCNSQPTRVCDDRNGGVPAYGGYVAKYGHHFIPLLSFGRFPYKGKLGFLRECVTLCVQKVILILQYHKKIFGHLWQRFALEI